MPCRREKPRFLPGAAPAPHRLYRSIRHDALAMPTFSFAACAILSFWIERVALPRRQMRASEAPYARFSAKITIPLTTIPARLFSLDFRLGADARKDHTY